MSAVHSYLNTGQVLSGATDSFDGLFEPSAVGRGDNWSIFKKRRFPHHPPFDLLSNPIHPPHLLRENPPLQPQCSSPVFLPPSWLSVSGIITPRFTRWSLTHPMILAVASALANPVPAVTLSKNEIAARTCRGRLCF